MQPQRCNGRPWTKQLQPSLILRAQLPTPNQAPRPASSHAPDPVVGVTANVASVLGTNRFELTPVRQGTGRLGARNVHLLMFNSH